MRREPRGSLRVLSFLMVAAMVAVFLLPSTIAIYAAVNGTAWDLQDLQVAPLLELLSCVLATFALTLPALAFIALPEATHPIASTVPLFELDCALIC